LGENTCFLASSPKTSMDTKDSTNPNLQIWNLKTPLQVNNSVSMNETIISHTK